MNWRRSCVEQTSSLPRYVYYQLNSTNNYFTFLITRNSILNRENPSLRNHPYFPINCSYSHFARNSYILCQFIVVCVFFVSLIQHICIFTMETCQIQYCSFFILTNHAVKTQNKFTAFTHIRRIVLT